MSATPILARWPALTDDSVRFTSNQTAILDESAACAVLGLDTTELDRYRDGDEVYVPATGAKMYFQPDDTWLICGYQTNGADILRAFPAVHDHRRPQWGRYLPARTRVTVQTDTGRYRDGVVAGNDRIADRGAVWVADPDGHLWTTNHFRVVAFRQQVAA